MEIQAKKRGKEEKQQGWGKERKTAVNYLK